MDPLGAVTTASKELETRAASKTTGPFTNSSIPKENTTRPVFPDVYTFTDSNLDEISFIKIEDPFLNPEADGYIFLIRKNINKDFPLGDGIALPKMHKECLITTGATAVFPDLISAALKPEALEAFARQGFTKLTLQVGEAMDVFSRATPPMAECFGLKIEAFDFNKEGLDMEMRACLAEEGRSLEGMVITHAGKLYMCLVLLRYS
jgi:hypothetical protein